MPVAARAAPVGAYAPIIAGPGDQSDPSISGGWIVFASSVAGDSDALRYRVGTSPDQLLTIAGGPGDQDQPDVYGTIVAHRGPGGVFVRDWSRSEPLRAPGGACTTESQPAVAARVAAWECETDGARSIAVLKHQEGVPEYRLGSPLRPGQHSPAAFGALVAFVDGADGESVWLHDSSTGATVPVCSGAATGVAVGDVGGRTVVAATRGTVPGDVDVEVWEPSLLVTALRIRGEQRNPHVSGDWVAFEDYSTEGSQVVLWQWTTGLVFLPHPSASDQTLNDLATFPGAEVRAVFAEAPEGGADRDIALYQLFLTADGNVRDDDGDPIRLPWDPVTPPTAEPPGLASCDEPDPVVLATLTVERGRGRPRAASVEFQATPPGGASMPVLVCVEANGVTAGWMTLDDEAIAWPGDFKADRARIAIPAVARGTSRLAGVIGGKPGAKVVVRVLADPHRPPPSCPGPEDAAAGADGDRDARHDDSGRDWDHDGDADHDQGFGNAGWTRIAGERFDRRPCARPPPPGAELGERTGFGCATAGGGGAFALLALVLAMRPKRRR